jgi:hypothetical protein
MNPCCIINTISLYSKYFTLLLLVTKCSLLCDIVESRLSDLWLSYIPFHPMCHIGTLPFINSHSEGLNSTETALAYVEQQREATATDVLLFRCWHDLAAKKRKEAQKQIPTTNFLKKLTLSFSNLHYVKDCFCLWDFSFDAIMHFLCNLIIS